MNNVGNGSRMGGPHNSAVLIPPLLPEVSRILARRLMYAWGTWNSFPEPERWKMHKRISIYLCQMESIMVYNQYGLY